jgi:site-specific recombinase XerD
MAPKKKRLLTRVREDLRLNHYSLRTEKAYVNWIRRYILFHNKRHPKNMGAQEIEAFLTYLAVDKNVAASTQNQAFSALLFLYRNVLEIELNDSIDALRAKKPKRLSVVLTKEEVAALLDVLPEKHRLRAQLLYGSGLRLMECLRLRVQDVDFAMAQIIVRDGKRAKDRITMLPEMVQVPLQKHLKRVKRVHKKDLADGFGQV